MAESSKRATQPAECQRFKHDVKTVCVVLSPQSLQFDRNQLAAVTDENESLRKQVEQMEGEAKK